MVALLSSNAHFIRLFYLFCNEFTQKSDAVTERYNGLPHLQTCLPLL